MFKKFLIFIFYLILILYSLEILTKFFIKDKIDLSIKNMDQLKKEKIQMIPSFDTRNDSQAFIEIRAKKNIFPSFRLSMTTINKNEHLKYFLNQKISQNNKIPFRGPINKFSLGSNEDGFREIVRNDKFGFKNNNKVYDKEIDVMIIGDSFAEGIPFGNENNVSAIINLNSDFNSINYGIGGTGPLNSLGILKEYGEYLKPKKVFYFFYEGNDLSDLLLENNTFLRSYLDDDFTQNLYNSKNEIDLFLDDFEKLIINNLDKIVEEKNPIKSNPKKNNSIEILKDIIELQNLKSILIPKDAYIYKNKKLDYETFEKIIYKMNERVEAWGGEFHLVYLPSWSRYSNNFSISGKFLKRKILKLAKKNEINIIDMDVLFKEKNLNNINLFNLGIYGHYTKKGYNFIAENIIKKLN